MIYVIHAKDVANSLEKRLSIYDKHLMHLQLLRDQGRLLIAGFIPAINSNDPGIAGFIGSVIVAEFDSIKLANLWAKTDPYFIAGIYSTLQIDPFKKVF